MGSIRTELEIINNSDRDIVHISVYDIDNYDWEHHRPDHNFEGLSIKAHSSTSKPEDVNSNAKNCPFGMVLEFRDGTSAYFRINQKYAADKAEANFDCGSNSHEISYHRWTGSKTLVITVKDNQEYLDIQKNNNKAKALNKQAEDLLSDFEFSKAKDKFREAYDLSNIKEDYEKFSNSLKAINLVIQGYMLLNSSDFVAAKAKFREACNLSKYVRVQDILSKYETQVYNIYGYNAQGFNKGGYNKSGYNARGFDKGGYDRYGYNAQGFDKGGHNARGFDKSGYDRYGYDAEGFGREGYNKKGFDKHGHDKSWYDKRGYDKKIYDKFTSSLTLSIKFEPDEEKFKKEFFYYAANYYMGLGYYERAIKQYNQVLVIDNSHQNAKKGKQKALCAQGEKLHKQGNYIEAIELFDQILALDDNHQNAKKGKREALCARCEELHKQGNYIEAIELYDQALKIEDINENRYDHSIFYSRLSELKYRNPNPKEGKEKALQAQSEKLFKQGKYEEAIRKYSQSYKIYKEKDNSEKLHNFMWSKSYSDRYKIQKDNIEDLKRQSKKLYEQGKYAEAAKRFFEACSINRISEEKLEELYLFHVASYDKAQGNYGRAIKLFDQVLILNSHHQEAKKGKIESLYIQELDLYEQGHKLWKQGEYVEAAKKYHEAYINCTDDRKDSKKLYLSNEANCYEMQEDYEKAIELYDQLLIIDNKHEGAKKSKIEILCKQGLNLYKQGNYIAAAEKYHEAYINCTSYSKMSKAHYLSNEASCYRMQGHYEKAIELCDQALVIDSTYARAKINKAIALYDWGKILWDQAWEIDEENSIAAHQKFEEAKEIFQLACNLVPGNSEYIRHYNMASLKIEGSNLLSKAMKLDKDAYELYNEAQELNIQQKYSEAHGKFILAKDKYEEAKQKFTEGLINKDLRFQDLIELAEEQISTIKEILPAIERKINNEVLAEVLYMYQPTSTTKLESDIADDQKDLAGEDYYMNL